MLMLSFLRCLPCLLLLAQALALPAQTDSPARSATFTTDAATEIIWDEWGVPHIYARTVEELGFAFGWAQMHSHGDLILELYGKARGRAAEYWGTQHAFNDQMMHTLGYPDLGIIWWQKQDAAIQPYLTAFVAGMNAYAEKHPDRLAEDRRRALPIQEADPMRHYLALIYTRFVGGGEIQRTRNWAERGSNTYAVAPQRSASGHAMLVQNPHLPWFGEFLFYEGHFNAPGIHLYGATLVGFPTLGIAFNEHLGWSHTNNTIDNADLYELTLQDEGYLLDGAVQSFAVAQKTIEIRQTDGSHTEQTFPIFTSQHGRVVQQKKDKALAIRMPGYDRYDAALQWWRMGKAQNLEEFEAALEAVQIPFFNVMYADRAGNIFHLFNGQVPKRSEGDWDFWQDIVPGDRSELIWQDVHAYAELPMVKNPPGGWLQNANDPPWTNTFPMQLSPDDFPPYMSPVRMTFRPQRSARMLAEDESITFEELVDYKLSTRWEMADRLLDDLFVAIDAHGGPQAQAAKAVLQDWDRASDVDSKGAVLFYLWAQAWGPWSPQNYATPWSMQAARTTPDGLADPAQAVAILEGVVAQMEDHYGRIDLPWGDFYRIRHGDSELPANGADGSVGVYRVAWTQGLSDNHKMYVAGGDSWVSVIEFGERVRAKALLSYGNATQPHSAHVGDQLPLFSEKKLRDVYFYREDVLSHLTTREVLREGEFVPVKIILRDR